MAGKGGVHLLGVTQRAAKPCRVSWGGVQGKFLAGWCMGSVQVSGSRLLCTFQAPGLHPPKVLMAFLASWWTEEERQAELWGGDLGLG